MTSYQELIEQGALAWYMMMDAIYSGLQEQAYIWNQLWLDAQDRIRDKEYTE